MPGYSYTPDDEYVINAPATGVWGSSTPVTLTAGALMRAVEVAAVGVMWAAVVATVVAAAGRPCKGGAAGGQPAAPGRGNAAAGRRGWEVTPLLGGGSRGAAGAAEAA